MKTIIIADFADWRKKARALLDCGIQPEAIDLKEDDGQKSLFDEGMDITSGQVDSPSKANIHVPRSFISLAETVGCHRSGERWNLLYRTLWRIENEHRQLLEIETDDDVFQLNRMEKQVRRDSHKMKAFVRFRSVTRDEEEFFVAWHQPDHRIVRRVAPFFSRRFAGMNWTILTPDESASWDRQELQYGPGFKRSDAPSFDQLEDLWRTYYANIFNPARVKVKMMKSEMAVRYWKNLPEAEIIDDLLSDAPRRVQQMIDQHEGFAKTAVDFFPQDSQSPITLELLKEAAKSCAACDLHRDASQTVFGSGPKNAKIVLLGEQPGDQEDVAGQPFVGPAGRILNEVLEAAGINRAQIYVTNIVKHFKHTIVDRPSGHDDRVITGDGKKRLHQKPNAREIRCCRPWFDAEWSCLEQAEFLVCLGATAAAAVLGPGLKVSDARGRSWESEHCSNTIVTWHPSAILRAANEKASQQKMAEMIEDLKWLSND